MRLIKILTILFTLFAFNGNSQVWDYPPEITKPYEPNETIKRENVKVLRIFQFSLVKGIRTGEKTLIMEQHFDSSGNTIFVIENSSDTTFYPKNSSQNHKPDIEYDVLNRPVKQNIGDVSQFWIYDGDKLREFYKTKNSILTEKRIFTYEANQLFYSKCYFSEQNKPDCDSVIATMNNENKPEKIVSFNLSDRQNINEMTVDYDEVGNNLGGTFNCSKIQFQYSNENYRTRLLQFDCEGVLIEDEEFEYLMYE